MSDPIELEVLSPTKPLRVTLTVRPEEIELALATNGNSLRKRLLLALVAELTTLDELSGSAKPPRRSRQAGSFG
jgi:hypothetical protein